MEGLSSLHSVQGEAVMDLHNISAIEHVDPTVPTPASPLVPSSPSPDSPIQQVPTTPSREQSVTPSTQSRTSGKLHGAKNEANELKKQISKLKSDLDGEKVKAKQLHRDRVAATKQIKDDCKADRDNALMVLELKLNNDKTSELSHQRDQLNRQKDQYVREIFQQHETEIQQLRTQFASDKDEAIRVALDLQKNAYRDQTQQRSHSPSVTGYGSGNSAVIVKLQREIITLRDHKRKLVEQLRKTNQQLTDMSDSPSQCDSVAASDSFSLHTPVAGRLNRSVEQADSSLLFVEKLEKVIEFSPSADSPSAAPGGGGDNLQRETSFEERDKEKERHLQRKVNDLTSQVSRVEKRVTSLKQENLTLKKRSEEQKPQEEKIKKLKKKKVPTATLR